MQEKMKAQVFYQPEDMRLKQVNIPAIAQDEVLIKVKVCGICGSDISYYWGWSPLETESGKGPLILGHEFSGGVIQVGKIPREGKLFKEGDKVTVDPVQYCNACDICAKGMVNLCENKKVIGVSTDGAFTEHVKSKYTGVHRLPQNVTYEQGACTEPLACVIYGVNNLNVGLGDFCVIMGPGPIGLMMLQLIKSRGAGTVALTGTRDYRLELGKKLGADFIFNTKQEESNYYVKDLVKEIKTLTKGKMANRVICPTGNIKAMHSALNISGRRAIIVYFGLPGPNDLLQVPVLSSIMWDKTIHFSWLAPFTWTTALQALSDKLVDVDLLITHKFSLGELVEGLEAVKNRVDNAIKGIVVYS